MHGKRKLFSKTSLICGMDKNNKFRRAFVWIAISNWFLGFILIAILVNSILLASTDYNARLNPEYES